MKPPRNPTPDDSILDAEHDVQARLGNRPLDFESLDAISNIYRAAASVRRRAEREVLNEYKLSFGGFTILWVLWVWGAMETARLADECGLAKGTLTGMLTTLEKQGLVERKRVSADMRRVMVSLTTHGTDTIDELFPKFKRVRRSDIEPTFWPRKTGTRSTTSPCNRRERWRRVAPLDGRLAPHT